MRTLLATISFLALAASLISSIICANDVINAGTNKIILLSATIVWFAVTPFWMRRKHS
jgi:hypothetical protein